MDSINFFYEFGIPCSTTFPFFPLSQRDSFFFFLIPIYWFFFFLIQATSINEDPRSLIFTLATSNNLEPIS